MKTIVGTAITVAALVAPLAHADNTDDAFVQQLGEYGITLPPNVSPSILGQTVCVYMKVNHVGVNDAAKALAADGNQGATFKDTDAWHIVTSARPYYCPDVSFKDGSTKGGH